MVGIYGKRASRETVRLLRATNACGVLLLARNIESPAQTKALTEELVQRLGRPLLFSVDHEGGWVLRFRSGVTAFPGNAALGRARDPGLAYAVGRQMALELGRLGIGLNLAPVLDVAVARYNPGIGIRSFGKDAALVARLGVAMIRGLQDHGVAACAKHFPGKGAATVDAHVKLPTIRLPRREFERVHLAPFAAAARAGVASVMTSHVRFPALDSKPATFSRGIIRGILRGKLGYDGVVISDDLCMGAVTARGPVPAAALSAFEAGHDILLIAHDVNAMRESVELLRELEPAGVAGSLARVETLAAGIRLAKGAPSAAAGEALGLRIARKAVEVLSSGTVPVPLEKKERPLLLFPDFNEVRERFTFEDGPQGPEKLIRALARNSRVLRTPIETMKGLRRIDDAVRRADRVVLFLFEAMRFPGQDAVLSLVRDAAASRGVVVLIRSPWDRAKLPPRMTAVDAYGYRSSQLRAALEVLGIS